MAYVKTNWIEMSMLEADKITALNNMETQYDEITSYATAINHDSRYYNETYCNANFFKASNDGDGSGLIATLFEGMTYDQVVEYITLSSIPGGCILIWAGTETEIPLGFKLCNGANSTPNILNKYPIVAGNSYSQGSTGGSNTALPEGLITIAGHLLVGAELPEHHHHTYDHYHSGGTGVATGGVTGYSESVSYPTTIAADSSEHDHNATFTGTNMDIRPLSMALCYIMKTL